jgi:alpha-galactosidase
VRNADKQGKLTLNEAEMWADYVGLFGGTKLNSDNLVTLRPERQELFRHTVALPACQRYVPLDFWQHGRDREDAFHVMLGEAGDAVYLAVFNWSDADRTYIIAGGPKAALQPVCGETRADESGGNLRLSLAAKHSAVFKLPAGSNFDQLRKNLKIMD